MCLTGAPAEPILTTVLDTKEKKDKYIVTMCVSFNLSD